MEVHSAQNNSRDLFRGIKNLFNTTTAKLAVIKDKNGKVLIEGQTLKSGGKSTARGFMRPKRSLAYKQKSSAISRSLILFYLT